MIGKLTSEQIEEILSENVVGRIACSDGKRSYVVPVNYVYDGKFIIAHSTPGMKIEMMRKNPQVCFEIDVTKSFTNWKSVIVWGEYQELTNERDRYNAMKLFIDKMMHIKISDTARLYETFKPGNIKQQRMKGTVKPIIYRIVITEKTGRFESRNFKNRSST